MPINFIVNDPNAVISVPMRKKEPLANRKTGQAGFNLVPSSPAALFAPDTADFVFWQSREAALTALQVWESLNGPLRQWGSQTSNPKKLDLLPDAGDDLNAYYDRSSLSFFHRTIGAKTFFSGASTDVVSHESGHAFLDALRPELFGTSITEHGAFHEAFGDCMAVLTALFDQGSRQALLMASPDLGVPNFVESLSEELSSAVKLALGANHPAAEPRHALNAFVFQLPTTLPTTGGPQVLTSEIHSFGRIFVGCFYDMVRNVFMNAPGRDEASLLSAAQLVGKLLIAGAQQAPLSPRFFQSVGRAILLADHTMNGGANEKAVTGAFSRHGISLGAMSVLTPNATLAGPSPRMGAVATGAALAPETLKDIKKRIQAQAGSKMVLQRFMLGDQNVVQATHYREVRLDSVSKELSGVVAYAPEPVLVGSVRQFSAVFNMLPDASTTEDEVHSFVGTLLSNDNIAFESKRKSAKAARAVATRRRGPTRGLTNDQTHVIEVRNGKKVLTRIRYLCR
jgi:hypothetical protein